MSKKKVPSFKDFVKNVAAKELSSGKFKHKIVKDKTKYDRKKNKKLDESNERNNKRN